MPDQDSVLNKAKKMAEKGTKKKQDKAKNAPKGNAIVRYFREVKDELRKVEWPKRNSVVRGTIIVIGISLFTAALLGAADYIFAYGLEFALQNF